MTELVLEADLDVWVGLPEEWGEDTYPDHASWARETAEAVWTGTAASPGFGPDGLALTLAMMVEQLPLQADFRRTWFWVPEPSVDVLPVMVDLFQAEDSAEATFAELADVGAEAVEPPVVEPFDFPHLGEGRSLLRYVRGHDDDLVLARHLYVRARDLDLHLHLATVDLPTAHRAMSDVEALARGARLLP